MREFQTSLLDLVEDNEGTPYWRAISLIAGKDLPGALAVVNQGIETDRRNWELLNLRGIIQTCLALGIRQPDAHRMFTGSLEEVLGKPYIEGLEQMPPARLQWDTRMLDQARMSFELAMRYNPFVPLFNIQTLNEVQKKPVQAAFQAALDEPDPGRKFQLHRQAADLFIQTGGWHDAIRRLEYLCHLRPDDLALRLELAGTYLSAAESSGVRGDRPPVIAVFPMKTIASGDDWIGRALPLFLHDAVDDEAQMAILHPALLDQGRRVMNYSHAEMLESEEARLAVSSLYGLRPDYLVTGNIVRFGNAIRVSLTIHERESGSVSTETVEVRGSLQDPAKLIRDLFGTLAFETIERVLTPTVLAPVPATFEEFEVRARTATHIIDGNTDEAQRYLQKEAGSGNQEAILALAEYYLLQNDLQEADSVLNRAPQALRSDWRYWHLLGSVRLAGGRTDQGCADLRKALAIKPDSPRTLELLAAHTDRAAERRQLNTRLMQSPNAQPRPYLENARIALAEGNPSESANTLIALLRRSRHLTPDTLREIYSVWDEATKTLLSKKLGMR